jgi:hypothetical protein
MIFLHRCRSRSDTRGEEGQDKRCYLQHLTRLLVWSDVIPPDFVASDEHKGEFGRLKKTLDDARERLTQLNRYVSEEHTEADLRVAENELTALRALCENLLRRLSEIQGK